LKGILRLDEVKAKIAPLHIPYPVLFSAEKATSDFGVAVFPATLILTKDWTIHRRHRKFRRTRSS
jgi:hypothetical protein